MVLCPYPALTMLPDHDRLQKFVNAIKKAAAELAGRPVSEVRTLLKSGNLIFPPEDNVPLAPCWPDAN